MSAAKNIEQLMDQLGAEIAISLKAHPTMTHAQLIKARRRAEMRYDNHDGGQEGYWVPEWTTRPVVPAVAHAYRDDESDNERDIPARVCVVWDRHTGWEMTHRRFMRQCFTGAGLREDDVAHVWAWPEASKAPPLDSQVASMRPFTLEAIRATNARYVLLIGAPSMKLWRREITLTQMAGHSGVWNREWIVFPMTNPISVMREPILEAEWRRMIVKFATMVHDGVEFELMSRCVEKGCNSEVLMFDMDAIGWCKAHYKRGIKRRGDQEGKMTRMTNEMLQPGML